MKEKIIDFLNDISPKWRARRLREREDYLTWVKDESSLTERELHHQEGWRRIYDCGSVNY